MAGEVAALQAIGEAWPLEQRAVLDNLSDAIEALHREALLRLIQGLRADPAAAAQLKEIVRDPFVFGVLRLHGIVRDPLEARVRAALESVAPMLAEHGGGVELVSAAAAGHGRGAPHRQLPELPVRRGRRFRRRGAAIKEHAPEIVRVLQVKRSGPRTRRAKRCRCTSSARSRQPATVASSICAAGRTAAGPGGAPRKIKDQAVLLHRDGDARELLSTTPAPTSACRSTKARSATASSTCPHHGFRYRWPPANASTCPRCSCVVHAVRVRDGASP